MAVGPSPSNVKEQDAKNRSLTRNLWIFAAGSFVFGFALVPLYRVLCDVTGYGDRTKLVSAAEVVEAPVQNREITVEFVSAAPTYGEWEFRPEAGTLKVQPGRLYEAKFYAKNLRSKDVTALAVPSVLTKVLMSIGVAPKYEAIPFNCQLPSVNSAALPHSRNDGSG